jgi:hypothetical protein
MFTPSPSLTSWLARLKNAKPIPADPALNISNAVKVVKLGNDCNLDPEVKNARGTIFIRPCYAKLFRVIWKLDKVALIGNPGVGKSCFQEYVLLRIVQSTLGHFTKIKKPPSCVIRQVGTKCFQLFLIKAGEAYEVTPYRPDFLNRFDPEKCLYLFEPGNDKVTEPDHGLLKTIATVSPNPLRIKEYTKKGAMRIYMPTWKLNELKQIGTYFRRSVRKCDVGFSEADIEERFDMFGGILLYIFPFSAANLEQILENQKQARKRVSYSVLLSEGAIIDSDGVDNVSHFFLQYDVDETTFRSFKLRFSSFGQRYLIEFGVKLQDYNEIRKLLSECARGLHPARRSQYLEIGVPLMRYHGVEWTKIRGASVSLPRKLELSFTSKDNWPKAADMKENIIYTPADCNYPFVEAYFKYEGKVHGIQCKSGTMAKAPAASPGLTFRDKIELTDTEDLYIWYIVFSDSAEAWSKTVEKGFTDASRKKLDKDQKKGMKNVKKSTHFGVLTHDFPIAPIDNDLSQSAAVSM